jgi:hypothetical protein
MPRWTSAAREVRPEGIRTCLSVHFPWQERQLTACAAASLATSRSSKSDWLMTFAVALLNTSHSRSGQLTACAPASRYDLCSRGDRFVAPSYRALTWSSAAGAQCGCRDRKKIYLTPDDARYFAKPDDVRSQFRTADMQIPIDSSRSGFTSIYRPPGFAPDMVPTDLPQRLKLALLNNSGGLLFTRSPTVGPARQIRGRGRWVFSCRQPGPHLTTRVTHILIVSGLCKHRLGRHRTMRV